MKAPIVLVLAGTLAVFASGPAVQADAVADWNATLSSVQKASGQSASGRSRANDIVRAALVGAITGMEEKRSPARAAADATSDANREAAASQAAYTVLATLYPEQQTSLDAQLAIALASLTGSPQSIAEGRAWGGHVAQIILAEHDLDVLLNPFTFSASSAPPGDPDDVGVQAATTGPGRYLFTLLAGSTDSLGSADGIGSAARFKYPSSLTVDRAGNVYVADRDNHTIRKITAEGVVSTLAGLAGTPGNADGPGSAARFDFPGGVTVDDTGTVYVADFNNHTIRKITPAGLVSTLAGSPGVSGKTDGPGAAARFKNPTDVAVDDAGNLYVADPFDAVIRKVTPQGTVSTLAMTAPFVFLWPGNIAADHAGNVFVIDSDGWDYSFTYKLTPTSEGSYAVKQIPSPPNAYWASSLAVDGQDNLYVSYVEGPISKVTPSGEMQTRYVAGSYGGYYWYDLALDSLGKLYSISSYPNRGSTILTGVFDPDSVGPAITQQPADGTARVGESQKLGVTAVGQPEPTYQWFRDSTALSGATNPILTLNNLQTSDAGNYTVVVTDGSGSVTSRVATLTVTAPAPTPTVTPPPIAPPPPTQTPSGSSSGGGGAPSSWFLGALFILFAGRGLRRCAHIDPIR